MKDKLCTAKEIQTILLISAPTLGEYVKLGLPKTGRNEYPLIPCIHWVINYLRGTIPGGSDGKKRKEMAQAQREELKLAKDRGIFIERDKVVSTVGTLISEAKTRILALPKRLSVEFAATDDPKQIEFEWMKENRKILEDLARPLVVKKERRKSNKKRA